MGTYYLAICEDEAEYLDPFELPEAGQKAGGVILGPLARLLAHMLVFGYREDGIHWKTARLTPDSDPLYERAREEFSNVTRQAVESFNDTWTEDDGPRSQLDPKRAIQWKRGPHR